MGTFVIIVQLILALAILVVLHELGHFIPARLFKIRVEKFYLFFNPWFSLFKFKKGDTEYGIGWLPLGGFVKISGMIDESMDTEQMKLPPKPYEFRSKPAWQRLIVMLGGVFVNVILAIFLYAMVAYFWGKDYVKNEDFTQGIEVLADEIKGENYFMDGDKILAIEGKKVDDFNEINKAILIDQSKNFTIERNGEEKNVTISDQGIDFMLENEIPAFVPQIPAVVNEVFDSTIAREIGLQKGDKIVTLNGKKTQTFKIFTTEVKKLKENAIDSFNLEVMREGKPLYFSGEFDSSYRFGFLREGEYIKLFNPTHISYSFSQSWPEGMRLGYSTLKDYVKQFKLIFTKKEAAKKVGGFGTIAKIFPTDWNWRIFWTRTAFLSVILAFMNILPIPALDGGHAMFLIYEMISGRPPSDRFMEKAQMFGLLILLSLMLFANGNDVYRWLSEIFNWK
ncbi:MAG: RIP metalloprotease RseP [Flavobacteriales bacterium]